MAVARDMQGRSNHVIAVIGDGAITGGMAYEAMNNAGYLDTNMIIVLNDNQQVSSDTISIATTARCVHLEAYVLTGFGCRCRCLHSITA